MGDDEEETPLPPYVYEGPRAPGESAEITATIEQEEGEPKEEPREEAKEEGSPEVKL